MPTPLLHCAQCTFMAPRCASSSVPALQMDHQFYAPDPNPQYDAIDLRALSEKRAARAALDAEWKRREALLARPYSFTLRCAAVGSRPGPSHTEDSRSWCSSAAVTHSGCAAVARGPFQNPAVRLCCR